MNEEFYTNSESDHDIERISEADSVKYSDIEGIETDEEYASFADPAEESDSSVPEDECSTQEKPLYDPATGERIPYGMTLKEWRKRKRLEARKKDAINARIEQDHKADEAENDRTERIKAEKGYIEHQKEMGQAAGKAASGTLAGHGEENITSDKLFVKPDEVSSEEGFRISDKLYTGKTDSLKKAVVQEKALINGTKVSEAGAVIMTGATALDGDTIGTYGDKRVMFRMMDRQENLSDMAEALTVKKGIPVNKSKDESSFVAKEIAAREEAEKKNNKSELFDDGDGPFVKDIEKVSASQRRIEKDYQTIKDGLEAVGIVAGYNIRTADDSEENDVKNGINIVRKRTDYFKMILGNSGMLAAASLDAETGARQSDLMEKCIRCDVDLERIALLADKKARIQAVKTVGKTSLKDTKEVKKEALRIYNRERSDLIRALQKKGLTKYEAKDLLRTGPGGINVAQSLLLTKEARAEILGTAEINKIHFTDEELRFLKSKAFFNTASNSRQISAITKKYFDKCGNGYLKKYNPAEEYLGMIRTRESARRLGPGIIGRTGLTSKVTESLDPHAYGLGLNLSKEVLRNKYSYKLDRLMKKDEKAVTPEQRKILEFQKNVEKHASYVERRKVFRKNKHSIKNVMRVGVFILQEIESDTTAGLNQVIAVKHGAEAAYSLMRLGLESAWVASKPIRFVAGKTGLTDWTRGHIDRTRGNIRAVIYARKTRIAKTISESGVGKGVRKAKTAIKSSKPALGVEKKHSSIKNARNTKKRTARGKRQKLRSALMNNPVARVVMAPFKGVAAVSKAVNRVKDVFYAAGHWILLAVGVTIIVWMVLLFISGYLMTLGSSLDITGHYVIMADQDLIEKWVNKYLEIDERKYEEAISHAEDEPIEPYSWGGTKLYHYGVYEPLNMSYFNRNYTNCYYHEKDQSKRYKAVNGFHVFYIDSEGNTLGNNTTNVKDVLSLTTAMTGNDLYSYQTEATDLMDKLYLVLNPEPALVESEIYACSSGCDTYPRKHVDGDPSNGNNWYRWSHRAYECNDASIYTEYERLLSEGVRFYPDDKYTYSSREYYERLVPQTENGCNSSARISFDRKMIRDIEYSVSCEGQTDAYKYDDSGAYYRSTETDPYTYASMFSSDDEKIEAVNNAGFYGRYSRDYDNTVPHTAIKCCYGHKDLNIFITVLTKDDLIRANGGAIEYRVPVHFSHETGEVTEWETRKTLDINSYTRTSTNLRELTKVFYEKGGFSDMDNQEIVDQIYGEDWYELYGINTYSGAAIPDTLRRESRVNRLDYAVLEDVSDIRQELVRIAYSQVGRIPYYWGGKASSRDLYANDFGSVVKPDYKGRRKKGLDCSGFVQLMICMASGAELKDVGSTTSSLVPSLGLDRVDFSELQPGDIGMENLPGARTNHIGIYAGNGMWIHCEGAPTNTVVYNNSNCFRYYYSLGG